MTKKQQNGFTMIETMISLIIISVGILGFALLQVESLKAAKTATERSKAINFSSSIIERIRTNELIINNYNTAGVDGPGNRPTICADGVNTNANTAPLPECSPAEIAAYEIWQWRTVIEDPKAGFGVGIGKGGININRPVGSPLSDVVVTVEWEEKGEPKVFVVSTRI